jgi:hypothetical protein
MKRPRYSQANVLCMAKFQSEAMPSTSIAGAPCEGRQGSNAGSTGESDVLISPILPKTLWSYDWHCHARYSSHGRYSCSKGQSLHFCPDTLELCLALPWQILLAWQILLVQRSTKPESNQCRQRSSVDVPSSSPHKRRCRLACQLSRGSHSGRLDGIHLP